MRISKKSIFKNCLIASTLIILAHPAGNAADEIVIEKARGRLTIGEELTFNVSWLGVNVGTCVSTVKGIEKVGDREAYVVELTARTNKVLSKIYPIDDTFTSYIDKEKFVTLKHAVRRREGRYRKDAITIFDYNVNKAFFANSLDHSKKTFDIPGYCQDSLSAAYYFRTLNVSVGQKIEYKVVNNEQLYDIIGLVKNTAYIRLKGAAYPAFYVEPYAKLKGQKVRKGRAGCWFSCDPARLPVYGIVKAPLFTKVTAVLVNVKPFGKSSGFHPE